MDFMLTTGADPGAYPDNNYEELKKLGRGEKTQTLVKLMQQQAQAAYALPGYDLAAYATDPISWQPQQPLSGIR